MQVTEDSYFSNTRPEVAALLPPGSQHVLEIGCGAGRFAGHVRGRRSYWGVEPSALAAQQARECLDTVLQGTFESVQGQLPDRHFDLVVCNDVIEHMQDHDSFLESIKSKMVPGAHLVGSVPNIRYLPHLSNLILRRDWKYTDDGVLDRTHLRFFTKKSFRDTAYSHGYQVEELVGLNSVLEKARWLGKVRWMALLTLLQISTLRNQFDCQHLQVGFRLRYPG